MRRQIVVAPLLLAFVCLMGNAAEGLIVLGSDIGVMSNSTAEPAEGTRAQTITVGDLRRTYYLHVPPNLYKDKPAALVLVFHGGGGSGTYTERVTKFSDLADKEGFLVAYPEGIEKHWNDFRGAKEIAAQRANVDDIAFVSALLDDVAQNHRFASNHVFATGISNGAIFSHYLAANLSARIAAIAPVVGGLGEPASAKFAPQHPVSVLILQGTADPLVPYEGGNVAPPRFGDAGGRGRVVSTDETVRKWVVHNGCRPVAIKEDVPDTDPKDGCSVTKFTWTKGKDGSEVILYRITGGGHTWPGGLDDLPKWIVGKHCRDINATEVIWTFFKAHPKP